MALQRVCRGPLALAESLASRERATRVFVGATSPLPAIPALPLRADPGHFGAQLQLGARWSTVAAASQAEPSSYVRRKMAELAHNRKWAYWGVLFGAAGVALGAWTINNGKELLKLKPPKKKDTQGCWLSPKVYTGFPLKHSREVTHDAKIFTFDLPVLDKGFGMPVASSVIVRMPKPDGEGDIIRSYTPISTDKDKGVFELLVKRYEGGPMSEHIFSLKPGDFLEVKGPLPKFGYEPNRWGNIGMIAGGTGLTPMLQIVNEILATPHDRTKVSLIFANKEEKDILLKDELDRMAVQHPEKFQVHYILDKPPERWTGEAGYVSKEMVEKYMPAKDDRGIILVSGPRQMLAHVCGGKTRDLQQGEIGGVLAELGYTQEKVYKF